ncbi:23S rRNA (uracil(1939)-C(5))-methyltransferase RlmD [Acholeplasma sp. OttesenSCG-928-E16]|nr:23S rRNA (uracil(1939)-C(5))-methyltransferase RlmD [Acholeplasma sp. OttesenSCG-928-E16]
MIKENDVLTLEAIDIDYQGNGVCKYDDMVIFVKKMITNEVALVKITSIKKNFAAADIVKLIKKSKDRRDNDTHSLGSLNLIHLTDQAQIKWQEKTTKDTFLKIAGLDVEINKSIFSSKSVYYRNKAVFHVMNSRYITLGLYQDNELKLKKTNEFILVDNVINKFLRIINESQIIVGSELYHVVFRVNSNNQILITFVSTKEDFDGLDDLIFLLRKHEEVIGITVNLKKDIKRILGDKSKTVFKDNLIDMSLDKYKISVNDRSFYQINSSIIKPLYDEIKEEINEKDIVIDAFSGVGSIGFYLSEKASKIILIDNNLENIEMAHKTKSDNNINNVEIIKANVEDKLQDINADVLIVDPPRNGLFPMAKEAILDNGYKKLIYLSCDPKTLARDIKELVDKYDIKKVVPIRMFPQTTSIETLVVLELK